MSRKFAVRGKKLTAGVIVAAALGGSLLTAVPAQAADPNPKVPSAVPSGTVAAQSGINERTYPSTDASVRGVIKHRTQIALRCKVRGQDVGGNSTWYMLRDRSTWISGKYLENPPANVPFCRSLNRSAMDMSTESQAAMG
ncbi:SH3 domain-containing protein [Streptomyces sp. NPDC049577]|uniref:SH3 domain-containing protein n=1 Tax=Streptomyces sp. NPDC049577 TaxID=3155153 RepID=UPI00342291E8